MNNLSMVSAEEFVRTWERAGSLQTVCDYFGVTKNTASCRAAYYRRKGVRLKIFEPNMHGDRLNVKRLNAIIEEEREHSSNVVHLKRRA